MKNSINSPASPIARPVVVTRTGVTDRSRSLTSMVACLLSFVAMAAPTELQVLKEELKAAAPPQHYPDAAEYKLFKALCTDLLCFKIVAVRSTSSGEEKVRLAVFSDNNHYIGSYAGLKTMPTRVVGSALRFPMAAGGDRIQFRRTGPPAEILINNETYSFQRSR